MAEAMSDSPVPVTILVCVNRRLRHDAPSCAGRGSEGLAAALEAAAGDDITVTRLKCFGRCAEGPNIRIRGGAFFRGCTAADIPRIIAAASAAAD